MSTSIIPRIFNVLAKRCSDVESHRVAQSEQTNQEKEGEKRWAKRQSNSRRKRELPSARTSCWRQFANLPTNSSRIRSARTLRLSLLLWRYDLFFVNFARARRAMSRWARSAPHTLIPPVTVAMLSEGTGWTMPIATWAAELALLFVFDMFVLLSRTGGAMPIRGWITESAFGHLDSSIRTGSDRTGFFYLLAHLQTVPPSLFTIDIVLSM